MCFVQFIQGQWKSGEREVLRSLAPYVDLLVTGRGFTLEHLRDPHIPMDVHQDAANLDAARYLALAEWIIRRPPSAPASTASPGCATGYDQAAGAPVPAAVATP